MVFYEIQFDKTMFFANCISINTLFSQKEQISYVLQYEKTALYSYVNYVV